MVWGLCYLRTWALPLLLAVILASCASAPKPVCGDTACSNVINCNELGMAALNDGHPEIAICFFKKGEGFGGDSGLARLNIAISKLLMGEKKEAVIALQDLSMLEQEPDVMEAAREWLEVIDNPLKVVFFWKPVEGCGFIDDESARFAARSLQGRLTRMGLIDALGNDVEPADMLGSEQAVIQRTLGLGARVGIIVGVRCREVVFVRNPVFLGGMVQVRGASATAVDVELRVRIVDSEDKMVVGEINGRGSAKNISRSLALAFAIDRSVANILFRVASVLLLGENLS